MPGPSAINFPPRTEALPFRTALEAKYQNGLRRTAQPTFVDVEGNVIWVQEYFRYRVSGRDHPTSQQKVFDQIDGRGVAADCASSGGGGSSIDSSNTACTTFSSSCRFFRFSISGSGTSERIPLFARAGEAYHIWIENLSNRTQNYRLEVRSTTASAGPLSTGDASSSRIDSGRHGGGASGSLKRLAARRD